MMDGLASPRNDNNYDNKNNYHPHDPSLSESTNALIRMGRVASSPTLPTRVDITVEEREVINRSFIQSISQYFIKIWQFIRPVSISKML